MKQPNPHQGLRHVALYATHLEESVTFYTAILGMKIVWQPDADNYYLSSGIDNFALHRAPEDFVANKNQRLDHIGFFLGTRDDVFAWHDWMKNQNVVIAKAPKDHRDGTTSFYCQDPDGNVVQMIYVP